MASRRWLWPCADSKVLRLPAYQNPRLNACLVHPDSSDDVLVSDSDDDLDDLQHSAKRRRIEAIAHSFLQGQPIYISSARLRGPFPAKKDGTSPAELLTSSAVNSPAANPTARSRTTAQDSFIRRRHKRPHRQSTTTPEPLPGHRAVLTPSKPPQSPSVQSSRPAQSQKSARLGPRSTKRKSLKWNLPEALAKSTPNHLPSPTPHLSSEEVLPPHNNFDHNQEEPQDATIDHGIPRRPSPSHPLPNEHPISSIPATTPFSSTDTGPKSSPVKPGNVLKQQPASSLDQPEKTLHFSPKFLTSLDRHKPHTKPNKYQASAAIDASSPFMYRKNAHLTKTTGEIITRADVPLSHQVSTAVAQGPKERRLASFDSSDGLASKVGAVPSPKPAEVPRSNPMNLSDPQAEDFPVQDTAHIPSSKPAHFPATDSSQSDPANISDPDPADDLNFTQVGPPTQPHRSTVSPAQSPRHSHHQDIPAIDISFGLESLGMNFDVLDRYTNAILPSSAEKRKSISDQIRRVLRESGASLTRSPTTSRYDNTEALHHSEHDPATEVMPDDKMDIIQIIDTVNAQADEMTSGREDETIKTQEHQTVNDQANEAMNDQTVEVMNDQETEAVKNQTDGTIHDLSEDMVNYKFDEKVEDHGEDFDNDRVDDFPYISTQAAMQDAHRALFDASSPENPITDPIHFSHETPVRPQTDRSSSPVHVITPFHEFNADMVTDTQAPLPSTQALFDAYSPLKLSIKKSKRASFAPSVIEEDAYSGISFVHENEQPEAAAAADSEEQHPIQIDQTIPDLTEETIFSPKESLRSGSDSPDVVLSQRSPSRNRDPKGPVLLQQSFRLSDIFKSVSSQRGVDVNSLFSHESPNSSGKFGKKKKSKSRSRTIINSSQPKPVRGKRVGQRKSLRISMSQPQPESEDEPGRETTDDTFSRSQANLPTIGFNHSFDISGSSTIPDPSLAIEHFHQNVDPASRQSLSDTDRQKSTDMSSFQPAQKADDRFDDLDSTIEELQRSVLQPWDIEDAMRNPIDASVR